MKSIILIFGISIVSQVAVAQCKPTITLSTSGCAGLEGRIEERTAESLFNHYMEQMGIGFRSKQECDAFVNIVRSELNNLGSGNCRIRINVSPCTGCLGSLSNEANIIAIGQGRSFFSTNPANEIQNWSNDDMERMLALNPEYKSSTPVELSTGNYIADYSRTQLRKTATFTIDPKTIFIPINMRKGGSSTIISEDLIVPKVIPANEKMVSIYLDNVNRDTAPLVLFTDKYIMWIKEQFKIVSGYDIDEILKSIVRTKEQREILRNYREFEKRLLDEAKNKLDSYLSPIEHSKEKKEVDMAIMALDSYDNDAKNYLLGTDYKRIRLENVPLDNPIRILANKINLCNHTNLETGFNAILYYNKKTNEYSLAFAGSALPTVHQSSELTLASKIAPSIDFDDTSKEYVVNALGLEVRIPQDIWSDWGKNNALQFAGRIASQYQMAKEIADIINSNPELKKLNINFIGHGLGGGVASVAGISTGKPTFTYNSEGVSDKMLEKFGLLDKKNDRDYNITAYHTDNDILTNAQKWAQGEGKKPMVDVISEETRKFSIDNMISQLEQLGYDTKTAKTLTGVIFDGIGADYNVFAKAIDRDNKKNNYVSTASGNEENIGNINSPTDELLAGGVGVIAGGIHLFLITRGKDLDKTYRIVKKTAELTDGALAHRMEPIVKTMMLKNVVQQNLWQRLNKEKQSMDREISNTEMRSMEQTIIVTD